MSTNLPAYACLIGSGRPAFCSRAGRAGNNLTINQDQKEVLKCAKN